MIFATNKTNVRGAKSIVLIFCLIETIFKSPPPPSPPIPKSVKNAHFF